MNAATREMFLKKTLDARWNKRSVSIDVPVDGFSSHQFDVGSRFLLRELEKAGRRWRTALDMGCGYGYLGLYLAATGLAERVAGFDRDALAVAFANAGAKRNEIDNVAFFPAIAGDADVTADHDLVVSNIPAKAGEGVHRLMLLGSRRMLTDDGEVVIVVVEPLETEVDRVLDQPNVTIHDKARRRGHVVYRYGFTGSVELPGRPYLRETGEFSGRGVRYTLEAWHGLPEFDTRTTDTDLLLQLLADHLRRRAERCIAISEPGQGHVAVWLAGHAKAPAELLLQSRDVLALRATRHNLERNGYRGEVREAVSADPVLQLDGQAPGVIVGRLNDALRDAHTAAIIAGWLEQVPKATVMVGGRAAYARRVEQQLKQRGIHVPRVAKQRGFAAMRITRS